MDIDIWNIVYIAPVQARQCLEYDETSIKIYKQ